MRSLQALFHIALCALAVACAPSRPAIDELHGVRLGMTPAEVRARFEPEGKFSITPSNDGGIWLEWSATGDQPITEARFEFHEGILVAIRAKHGEDGAIAVQRLDVSPWAVRYARVDENNRAETTLLARGCPAHESEVQELLALR
ncbi:MAG: hypothetical protein GXY23_13265 [Myxococcales bacterium]|jgi:hypothetical protein|nr:hypothetical protein [Myxococcales bacterium]